MNRAFIKKTPSKVWFSDISYIRSKEGFVYLTTIMDLYDRKIIGWSFSDGMSIDDPSDSEQAKQNTLEAWNMAVKNRNIEEGFNFPL